MYASLTRLGKSTLRKRKARQIKPLRLTGKTATRKTTDLALSGLSSARYREMYLVKAAGKANAPSVCTKPRIKVRKKICPSLGPHEKEEASGPEGKNILSQ